MTYINYYESPIGRITMSSDGEYLTGLWFDGQKYDRAGLDNDELAEKPLPVFDETEKWLDTYFEGRKPVKSPKLKLTGSDFRKLVAEIMLSIPYGQTMTYKEIALEVAHKLGKDHMSCQAVGGAVGHNRISIIIPCHRVLGTDGSLTGYAGGIERKRWLLEKEGVKL